MKKCLVTGGRGFIGSSLCRLLEEDGHAVEIFDIEDGCSILEVRDLQQAARSADVVFDCCGKLGSAETFADIRETIEVNLLGTLNVLEVCRILDLPLIHVSLKNSWANPYMISKRAGSELCRMFSEYLDTQVSVVRGLNAYGPLQKWGHVRKMIPTFIVNCLNNEPLKIFGDGQQIVDLIYVDDLSQIIKRLWEREVYGVEIDGGTGVPVKVIDVAELVIKLTQSNSRIEFVPMRKGEPFRAVALADPSDAVSLLDYYPSTPLLAGLNNTVQWYKKHWQEMKR